MKILAINASYRGDEGHTRFLIDKLFAGATAAGAECQVVTLARLKINRCLACGQCQTAEHSLKCVYDDKDDVAAVFGQMAEMDIVVYAAYQQAGRELAAEGRIRRSTERRANQEIVPVSLFSILKRLKPFKRIMVERAREMI